MNFLIDAHLPRRLARWLDAQGHDARHTLDLPSGNATPDAELLRVARLESRVIVTKDADFIQSYFVTGEPERLLLVSTGNIGNARLDTLFANNLAALVAAFETARFVEITQESLIVHE